MRLRGPGSGSGVPPAVVQGGQERRSQGGGGLLRSATDAFLVQEAEKGDMVLMADLTHAIHDTTHNDGVGTDETASLIDDGSVAMADDSLSLERAREAAQMEELEIARLQRDLVVLEAERERLLEQQVQAEQLREQREAEMLSVQQQQHQAFVHKQKELQRQLRDLKIGVAMKQEMVDDLAKAHHDTQALNEQYAETIARMEADVAAKAQEVRKQRPAA
jgi:hypothetical protein